MKLRELTINAQQNNTFDNMLTAMLSYTGIAHNVIKSSVNNSVTIDIPKQKCDCEKGSATYKVLKLAYNLLNEKF